MCKVDNIREKYNGQTKLYDFYRECYPTDTEMIEQINRNATFQDAFECLQVGFDFYAFLGVGDSIVRERVFDALATLMGCSYDHVYYQWLNHSVRPLRGVIIDDMTGLRFKNGNETAVRVLNFVMPYIPEHIREEAEAIAFNK